MPCGRHAGHLSTIDLSSLSRSIHYVPHFIEFFAEDIYFVSLMMQTLLLKSKYKQLAELAILMEDSFQQRGNRIAQKFQQRAKNILRIVFSLLACLEISFVLEVLFPRDKEDRELWGKVYKTKHPERKLPVNIWIPTIDESESGIYQWIFIYEVYVLSVVIVLICVSFTLMPILILYLKGQHVILCEYIEKIGARHYDVEGQEIHFTNIETNEYTRILNNRRDGYNSLYKRDRVENMIENENRIILYDTWVRDEAGRSDDEFVRSHRTKHRARRPPQNSRFDPNNKDHFMETPVGGPTPNSAQSTQDESYSQEMYQRRYLRQIIRFHQKLLVFQDKVGTVGRSL